MWYAYGGFRPGEATCFCSTNGENEEPAIKKEVPPHYSVTLRNLEKRFGDFVAVNRVSLEVKKG